MPLTNAMLPTVGASSPVIAIRPSGVAVADPPRSATPVSTASGCGVRTWTIAALCDDATISATVPCRTSLPGRDDHDVVGEQLHLGQQVAGDQHGAALRGETAEELAHPADALRVEPVGRLVEDQHPRVAQHRGGDAEPLLMPSE